MEQELRWVAGQPKKLEDYLDEWPELRGNQEAELELLAAECRTRAYCGARATPDEIQGRFPVLADRLDLGAIAAEAAMDRDREPEAWRFRCPHCHNAIEVVDARRASDVVCPSCSSSLSLVGGRLVPIETDATATQAGRRIGHWELIEIVGADAVGTVWKARDLQTDHIVAIKLPRHEHTTLGETKSFLKEAQAAHGLRHPNIVRVLGADFDAGTVYIVSDFVDGESLDKWLLQRQPSERKTAELCAKTADALDYAHRQGVVHRDLKPSNVMLDASGEPQLVAQWGLGALARRCRGSGVGKSRRLRRYRRVG